MPAAEVGITDGPKGVVVNTRNGKAYAAFQRVIDGASHRPLATIKVG